MGRRIREKPLPQAFHTSGVDWQADSVTWYFDGTVIKKFTHVKAIPHKPMYVLVDLAVGLPGYVPRCEDTLSSADAGELRSRLVA